jgi:NAD(P)-dependent dehydrogenase (short-subunit alcohol dehydrogenase family)
MMELGLMNKVAIITGGSDGIGKAAAYSMAREGARVVIVARRPDVLKAAADDIQTATQGVVLPIQGDVAEAATADRIVKTTLDRFGRIDILVNNAGTSMAKPFEAVSDGDWEADFNLKVWAAVRLIRAVIPEMRKVSGGRIINVTGIVGRTPGPRTVPTSIARAAGIALTKALSKDLAHDNILVNTVCIGFIKSGQHERRYAPQRSAKPSLSLEECYADEAKARAVPLGRVGESHEAGDVIAFLASDRASYLTGIAVNIDGGTSAVV